MNAAEGRAKIARRGATRRGIIADNRQPWTGPEFGAFGLAIFGYGWQSAMARALGVNDRTIRRWVVAGPPAKIREEILRLAGVKDIAGIAFPRDEWIVGEGPPGESGQRREYLIHARAPRFIARIVAIDEITDESEPGEGEVDERGVIYAVDPETRLAEFQWIDRPPATYELVKLMEAAADAIDENSAD